MADRRKSKAFYTKRRERKIEEGRDILYKKYLEKSEKIDSAIWDLYRRIKKIKVPRYRLTKRKRLNSAIEALRSQGMSSEQTRRIWNRFIRGELNPSDMFNPDSYMELLVRMYNSAKKRAYPFLRHEKVYQRKTGKNGDCLAACLATLFGLDLKSIPDFNKEGIWPINLQNFVRKNVSRDVHYYPTTNKTDDIPEEHYIDGLVIAIVADTTSSTKVAHAIILDEQGNVYHDPENKPKENTGDYPISKNKEIIGHFRFPIVQPEEKDLSADQSNT